ncbi:MAG: DNA-directed RNA polymerase subunit RpoH/Rpb5 C-terminal domain-containing protein [archaeon]
MHVLQPKHSKTSQKEAKEILQKLNISSSQLPKINVEDPALPEGCEEGDLIKIERKTDKGTVVYYRIVV